ncbi:MAG: hypothetical protein KC620_06660 [Myxococcales bacterium]|nr:hypothetical protein [Myxococcales bacterium]
MPIASPRLLLVALLGACWAGGCDDGPSGGSGDPTDGRAIGDMVPAADPPDAGPRDAELDAADPLDAAPPVDLGLDAAPIDAELPDALPVDVALPIDAALPVDAAVVLQVCGADVDCNDPLAEACLGGFCEAAPCNLPLFRYDAGDAELAEVHVGGDFNGWADGRGEGVPMERLAGSSVWIGRQRLQDGVYTYKFVLYRADGAGPIWITDPANPETADDGFGGQVSVLQVQCR